MWIFNSRFSSGNTTGFFDGINSPFNPEPTKLEAGCQFIMMNYQMIDTINMSNYTYIFKDSSFVKKRMV